jgi:filamentous hemagglutinin family protein
MQTSKTPQLTLISAAVLLAMGASRNSFALPSGEQVSAGQATIQRPSASSMVINQAAPKAVVNWQSFSIGQRESVDVRQPSASAVLLNRVVGVDASSIQGRLTANGQVFLLNPNGILFGPTSQVTVGGIVASTLSMTDKDFYSGNYKLTGTGKPGSVQIQAGAQITAHDHGYIGVLGGR